MFGIGVILFLNIIGVVGVVMSNFASGKIISVAYFSHSIWYQTIHNFEFPIYKIGKLIFRTVIPNE